jgi:hypothetical protein
MLNCNVGMDLGMPYGVDKRMFVAVIEPWTADEVWSTINTNVRRLFSVGSMPQSGRDWACVLTL